MNDDVQIMPIAVGGLGIRYEMEIGPGRSLKFDAVVDGTVGREDLDETLDRIGGAAERMQAVVELPIAKATLMSARDSLKDQIRERDKAIANDSASRTIRSRGSRGEAPSKPADINAISQFDDRIAKLRREIVNAELRIPYLEALIDRDKPPDLFPELQDNKPLQAAE